MLMKNNILGMGGRRKATEGFRKDGEIFKGN